MRKSQFAILLFLQNLLSEAHASLEYPYAQGWHWYEEFQKLKEEKHKSPLEQKEMPSPRSAASELQKFKARVEELKAIAVMSPTFENVRAYMEIQKILLEKSSRFAQRWLEVLYQTPSLDYSLKHPISQAARHVYLDEERREMSRQIKALSQSHGLFFFFSNKCLYCREFAPIVKQFADRHSWKVLGISTDGSTLPEFPDARNGQSVANALGVKALPALLAVSPDQGQVIPLSYGMSTQDQIEDRIRVLILKRSP